MKPRPQFVQHWWKSSKQPKRGTPIALTSSGAIESQIAGDKSSLYLSYRPHLRRWCETSAASNAIIDALGIGEILEKTIPRHADPSPACYPPALPQSRRSQSRSSAIGSIDCNGSNGAYRSDRRSLRILPIIGISLGLKSNSYLPCLLLILEFFAVGTLLAKFFAYLDSSSAAASARSSRLAGNRRLQVVSSCFTPKRSRALSTSQQRSNMNRLSVGSTNWTRSFF
jgi:hypothetical protein